MALPPAPSLTAYHGVATGVPIVALLITISRLYYRIKRKLAWWDDLLVGFASLWLTLLVIFTWIFSTPGLPQGVKVAAYYMCTYTFTLANYFARLSILVGILRIAPHPRTRSVLKLMAGFFVTIMCVLLAQKLWVCEGNSRTAKAWKTEPNATCHLGLQVALTELVTDIVSDAFLVITPLTFLSRSKLKTSQKRRLYAIFCASSATTITSIVQDYLILAAGGLREVTASMMEVSVAIIVANLPVIVSWIYRLRHKRDGDTTHSRFATDYDHSRRAKPGVWAQRTRDLISSSDGAGTDQLTNSAIQLGDARRPNMRGHLTNGGEGVLDLGGQRGASDDLDTDVKVLDSLDDQVARSVKVRDFDPERSYESSRHSTSADRKQKNDGLQDGGVEFTVPAISYGGGRDAEYGVDVIDGLGAGRQHQPPSTGITITDTAPGYLTYSGYPAESQPFTQNRIPISSEHHDGVNSYPNGEHPSLSPASPIRSPTRSQLTLPSPPPTAASVLSPERSRSIRRSPLSATLLGRPGTSPSDERSQRQPRTHHPPRSRSPASQSRAHVALDDLFGRGNGGVLVQQQVHVATDAEDEVTSNGVHQGRR